MFVAISRARAARRFPGALRRSDLLEPPGRRCGCWRRRHLRFSEIVGWQILVRADDELRRSMLTSASPARSDGAGAGADRAKARYGVIDNRSENLQHLQRRRLLSLAHRCGGCGTERSSEFGSVNPSRCPHARARGATIPGSSEAERPARAAWSALRLLATSSFLFLAELLVGRFRFGADDGALAIDADVGFAGSERRRWCRRRSS